jgi:hypothetical protein
LSCGFLAVDVNPFGPVQLQAVTDPFAFPDKARVVPTQEGLAPGVAVAEDAATHRLVLLGVEAGNTIHEGFASVARPYD